MIETKNISKSFDDIKAVDSISLQINENAVFGLIGTNGAGKSTFLRMLCGILKPDNGEVLIDGECVFENPDAKDKLFYISDEQYFLPNSTPEDMAKFYSNMCKGFDMNRFHSLLDKFDLPKGRKINTFSKGMKKQLSIICGICAGTKYLLCDETFDGLDPVMRQAVKSIFAGEMADRDFTPIIASHNLRELEDICDHVGLLHKGGVILSKNLEELKISIHKIQCVVNDPSVIDDICNNYEVLMKDTRGSLVTLTIRGNGTEVLDKIKNSGAVFAESLPLSLEEIFISETGVNGYDIKKLIY